MDDLRRYVARQWPGWQALGEIGQGASARVYRAQKTDGSGEEAAVKAILIPDDWEEQDSLLAEGQSDEQLEEYYAAQVKQYTNEIDVMLELKGRRHIVSIDDYCVLHPEKLKWLILIRMPLLTPLLRQRRRGGFDEAQIVRAGTELCEALQLCHQHKIVHGDIKPANIFRDESGGFLLGDFGTSRKLDTLTRSFTWKGTPSFMAPEIYRSEPGTSKLNAMRLGDIYSLGLVLYTMANGARLPFVPESTQTALHDERMRAFNRRLNGEALPKPAEASDALAAVILKACAYKPEDRFQSVEAFAKALKELQTSQAPRPPEPKKRPRAIAALLIGALLLASIVLCLALPQPGGHVRSQLQATKAPTPSTIAASAAPSPAPSERVDPDAIWGNEGLFSASLWTGERNILLLYSVALPKDDIGALIRFAETQESYPQFFSTDMAAFDGKSARNVMRALLQAQLSVRVTDFVLPVDAVVFAIRDEDVQSEALYASSLGLGAFVLKPDGFQSLQEGLDLISKSLASPQSQLSLPENVQAASDFSWTPTLPIEAADGGVLKLDVVFASAAQASFISPSGYALNPRACIDTEDIAEEFNVCRCDTSDQLFLYSRYLLQSSPKGGSKDQLTLFVPSQSEDLHYFADLLNKRGIPAYAFTSAEPEAIYQEYMRLLGLEPLPEGANCTPYAKSRAFEQYSQQQATALEEALRAVPLRIFPYQQELNVCVIYDSEPLWQYESGIRQALSEAYKETGVAENITNRINGLNANMDTATDALISSGFLIDAKTNQKADLILLIGKDSAFLSAQAAKLNGAGGTAYAFSSVNPEQLRSEYLRLIEIAMEAPPASSAETLRTQLEQDGYPNVLLIYSYDLAPLYMGAVWKCVDRDRLSSHFYSFVLEEFEGMTAQSLIETLVNNHMRVITKQYILPIDLVIFVLDNEDVSREMLLIDSTGKKACTIRPKSSEEFCLAYSAVINWLQDPQTQAELPACVELPSQFRWTAMPQITPKKDGTLNVLVFLPNSATALSNSKLDFTISNRMSFSTNDIEERFRYLPYTDLHSLSMWTDNAIRVNLGFQEHWNYISQLALFIPERNEDLSYFANRMNEMGMPAYAFSSSDPDAVYAEYMDLLGLDPEAEGVYDVIYEQSLRFRSYELAVASMEDKVIAGTSFSLTEDQKELNVALLFTNERLWADETLIKKRLLDEAFSKTPLLENWRAVTCDPYTDATLEVDDLLKNGLVIDYAKKLRADLVLIIHEDNEDTSALIEKLTAAGCPAYAFLSADPDRISREYLKLIDAASQERDAA